MPIYEYQCQDCGHKLEVMQRMSEDPLKTCPQCAHDSLKKLISAVGFQLKGTGWYETDFKNKGKPARKQDDSGNSGSGDKAETKGAASKSSDKAADSSSSSSKSDSATTSSTTKTASSGD